MNHKTQRTKHSKEKHPRILVGSPVYSDKKYVTPNWIESVRNISYENYDILVVDNSRTGKNKRKIRSCAYFSGIRKEKFA